MNAQPMLFLGVACFGLFASSSLSAQEVKPRATLQGHTKRVNSVAFSPDGKTLASGSQDRTIILWDVATGQKRTTFQGHDASVESVAFSPDGKILASGSFDQTIKLRDVATGKDLATLTGHSGEVTSVAFNQDGRTLASGSWDKTIKVWDIATGRNTITLDGHKGAVNALVFSPGGKTLASATDDKAVLVWDVATGKTAAILQGSGYPVRTVAFSPDGQTLAWGSDAHAVEFWDTATGKKQSSRTARNHSVFSVAFRPDGKALITASEKTIQVWEMASGKERVALQEHTEYVWSLAVSPDGRTLASGSGDKTVKLWDVPVVSAPGSNTLSAKDPDGLWNRLADADASDAYEAMRVCIVAPQQAIALLKDRLRPVVEPTPQQITGWIADLDADQFTVRQKAREELEHIRELAETALRKQIAEKPSLQVRQQIDQLLTKIEQQASTPEWSRLMRALEVLELIGTAEAKAVVETLATGAEGVRLTQEAKASLQRLKKRIAAAK